MNLQLQCQLADTTMNAVWYDNEGCKLVHYFPHLISSNSQSEVVDVFKTLISLYPPNKASMMEKRSSNWDEWSKEMGLAGNPCGVYRFIIHHMEGHPYDPPVFSTQFFTKTSRHTNAAIEFRQSDAITKLSEYISLVFAGIDPVAWKKYRTAYLKSTELFPILKTLDTSSVQCYVGYYLLVNILTTCHQDLKDPPDGWVAMVAFGDYENGKLCIPDIRIKFSYKSGDVIFFRSWALKHFIQYFIGSRYVIVFSTTQKIFEWLGMVL